VRLTSDRGRHVAHPGYPSIRLWPDVHDALIGSDARALRADSTEKRRVAAKGLLPLADKATRLGAICLLGQDRRARHVSLAALSPREALLGLMPLVFQLDVQNAGHLQQTMDQLGDLVERVPAVGLSHPRQLASLPGVVEAIEARFARPCRSVRPQPDVRRP
jgi:hypothetical protein